MQSQSGQSDAQKSTASRQKQILNQELSQNAMTACTKGHPQAYLPYPPRCFHQEQIGYIRARKEQNQAYDHKEHHQNWA
jgi:hypothetical protein